MLTHTQIKTLHMLRNRGDSILSKLPKDIIRHISRMNTAEHVVTDTAALLPYVIGIDGQPVQMVEQLGEQPRLLLEPSQTLAAGTLLTPSNVVIGCVLPKNIIHYIRQINSDENGEPVSEIGRLLKYIAYGNPAAAEKMLKKNPRLLLQAGDVVAPSGDLICRVSPYELALCIGDHHPDMIPMIAAFFAHPSIEGGEAERKIQYARYKNDIDNMLKQKPYDFSWIIEIIKASTPDEVTAALNKDIEYGGVLCDALAKFRQEFSPRIVTKGLLFNYATLHEAFKVLADNVTTLYASNGKDDKCNLVWRQLIGRIVDLLPACERQAFATCYLSEDKSTLERSFKFKHGAGNFPFATNDESRSGAGWDFSCDVFGMAVVGSVDVGAMRWCGPEVSYAWKNYVEKKFQTCKTYAATCETKNVRVCDLLAHQRYP
jgi:hypothetical protein